ncbi:MAG: hypothetical protein KBS62_00260 [Oscillospiraceae bacterium]|nr:hypothetical protein [Candidatus Ruminococcus equi]
MKQLTDEEIIEALELCVKARCSKNCSYKNIGNANCIKNIIKDSLDLINRQKAEIEKLKEENKIHQELLEHEIGSRIALRVMYDNLSKNIKTAKSEAYKEFAERLCEGKVSNDKTVIEAEVLLKEMVGEK